MPILKQKRLPFNYVEAYPRLDVRDARKFWQRGRRTVTWRTADRTLIGVGYSDMPSTDSLRLQSHFRDLSYLHDKNNDTIFKLFFGIARGDNASLVAICPNCQTNCRTLIMLPLGWSCRNCQPLTNRSKMVGEAVRKSENIVLLRAKVGAGRPKGMHNATYYTLVEKLRELERDVGDEPVVPSVDYAQVVTAWWSEDPKPLDNVGLYPPFREGWASDER